MRLNRKLVPQMLALLVTCALMQVYVMATPPVLPGSNEKVSTTTSGAVVFGRLSSIGTGRAVVNGNEVVSGTTILSGAQIQTPDSTAATITLGSVGKLDIAPKTNLTLSFDKSSVTVNVISGDAFLTTYSGVSGSLTGPDGKTMTADGQNVSSVGTAKYQSNSQDDDQGQTNRRCRIAGMPCALFWVLVGGGTAVVIGFAATRGNNPSPSNPTS